MSKTNYYRELKRTSDIINPKILEYLDQEDFKDPVKKFIEILPKRRTKNPRLRDLLLRLSYQVSGGENWQKIIPPYTAAIELYNNSTYIINWFLDGKGELKNKDDEKCAVNAGFILRDLAQKIILEQKELSDEKTLEIICELTEINSKIYIGQNIDIYKLTINRFEEFKDKEIFLPLLYDKGRLVCGDFSAWITDIGIILAGNETYKEILNNFAMYLSSGIQLANDAGDFVPSNHTVKTPDKSYKDQVTDIFNGRLTLSTWYCLKYGNQKQKDTLLNLVGKKNPLLEEQENAVYALRDSGAFNFVLSEATKIMNKCKKTLYRLPESEERNLLLTMSTICRTNKFYATLREKYDVKV